MAALFAAGVFRVRIDRRSRRAGRRPSPQSACLPPARSAESLPRMSRRNPRVVVRSSSLADIEYPLRHADPPRSRQLILESDGGSWTGGGWPGSPRGLEDHGATLLNDTAPSVRSRHRHRYSRRTPRRAMPGCRVVAGLGGEPVVISGTSERREPGRAPSRDRRPRVGRRGDRVNRAVPPLLPGVGGRGDGGSGRAMSRPEWTN